MEQRLVPGWTLLAPRKETVFRFNGVYRSDYPRVCREAEDRGWNSWHCLAWIPRKKLSYTQFEVFRESRLAGKDTVSAIEALPGEIVGLILQQLALFTARDIINFGISSPVLWRDVLAYLHVDCTRTSGALCGVEISLFCDDRHDLPELFKRDNYALIDKILRRRHGKRQLGPFLTPEELNRSTLVASRFAEMETTPEFWMRTLEEDAERHLTRRVTSRLADYLHWACKIAPLGHVYRIPGFGCCAICQRWSTYAVVVVLMEEMYCAVMSLRNSEWRM